MFRNSAIWGDIRYAVRIMYRAPLFTAAVVLTVAIAANAAMFTVVNAVRNRSLPFAEPNRILQVAEKNDKLNLPTFAASVHVRHHPEVPRFHQRGSVSLAGSARGGQSGHTVQAVYCTPTCPCDTLNNCPGHLAGIRGISLREGASFPRICWRSSVGRASDL